MANYEKRESAYRSSLNPIRGRSNREVVRIARRYYKDWLKECSGRKGKRRPAVKVKGIKDSRGQKRKVFIDRFQQDLKQKNIADVARRMKLLPCVRDLLENAALAPKKQGKNFQFNGQTPGGELFQVIVKEEKGTLYLLTFYPNRK